MAGFFAYLVLRSFLRLSVSIRRRRTTGLLIDKYTMANPTRAKSSRGSYMSRKSSSDVDGEDPITVTEVMHIAKRKLPGNVFDYYSSGADDELAVARNIKSFDR